MKVRIKRFDTTLPLPEYKTKGAAGFDLSVRITTTIAPHTVGYVPLNVVIEPPEGHYVALVARSSLHKRGLMPANGFGVGDRDYSGNEDEYKAALLNFTDKDVVVERGERIMQVVISPVVHVEFLLADVMGHDNVGGFVPAG